MNFLPGSFYKLSKINHIIIPQKTAKAVTKTNEGGI